MWILCIYVFCWALGSERVCDWRMTSYDIVWLSQPTLWSTQISACHRSTWFDQQCRKNSEQKCKLSPFVSWKRRLTKPGVMIVYDCLSWNSGTSFDDAITMLPTPLLGPTLGSRAATAPCFFQSDQRMLGFSLKPTDWRSALHFTDKRTKEYVSRI